MVMVKYEGNASALIDNASFLCIQESGVKITVSPTFYVATPGETLKAAIKLDENSKPLADVSLKAECFEPILGYHCISKKDNLKTGKNGTCQYSFKVPTENYANGLRLSFTAPQKNAKQNLFIPVYPAEKVKEMKTAAKAVKLKNNLHILYIGDSLTDMNRGNNYTNIVNYYLNMFNPGKASFKNAGVGGDYIGRTWMRLKGFSGKGKPAWRQYMYNDLLKKKPNLIFILLGGNDTKASNKYD